jgi:hypothetical protein
MYSLAADVLGGAPSIYIPIKLNKAVPSSAHQSNAPMTDATATADQELLVKTTLRSVWSHMSSPSLGGLPSPATCAASVTPPSCRLRADRAGHVVAGAHGHAGALPSLAQSNVSCAAVASLAAKVFRNPIACMCGALGLPYNSPYSKGTSILPLYSVTCSCRTCRLRTTRVFDHLAPSLLPPTELVLLDLAVMKAASQPHMHSFYAQIVAQRNAYAMQACMYLLCVV